MMDIPLTAQVYGPDVFAGVFEAHALVSSSWKVGMLDDPQGLFRRSKCGHFVTRVHEPPPQQVARLAAAMDRESFDAKG